MIALILAFGIRTYTLQGILGMCFLLLIIGVLGFFLCRIKQWLIVLFLPLSLALGLFLLEMKNDSWFDSYKKESNLVYAVCFTAIGISAILPIIGVVSKTLAKKSKTKLP
jgi:hypothetical protein